MKKSEKRQSNLRFAFAVVRFCIIIGALFMAFIVGLSNLVGGYTQIAIVLSFTIVAIIFIASFILEKKFFKNYKGEDIK